MSRVIVAILVVLLLLAVFVGNEILILLRGGTRTMANGEETSLKVSSLRNASCDKELLSSTSQSVEQAQLIDTAAPALLSIEMSTLMSLERGSLCPELTAASRFALSTRKPPFLNMTMVQLVGQWADPKQRAIMEQVFEHNRKVCHNNLGILASSITKEPATFADVSGNNSTNKSQAFIISPAFWKMRAIQETCAAGYDVVWFLDADIVITEAYYPIKALWHFHQHFHPKMDILMGLDVNGVNTGTFLVNCQSPTALEFLDEWHAGAPRIAYYNPGLYEQTFLQYVLEHGSYWNSYIPTLNIFRDNPVPKWNNFSAKARDKPRIWSTEALRNDRVPLIQSPCAMSGYLTIDGRARQKGQRPWQLGDVTMHMAGLKKAQKMARLMEYVDRFRNITKQPVVDEQQSVGTSQEEVALAYLKSHTPQ